MLSRILRNLNKHRLFFIVISLVILALFSTRSENQQSTQVLALDALTNPIGVRSYWLNEINHLGLQKAYSSFLSAYQNQSFTNQHLSSHIVGALIYEKGGPDGIAICQQAFAYGCFHGFFGSALSVQGLSVIPRLDKVCIERYSPLGTGCLHGIGHGIMEYLGPDKLTEALEYCSSTTQRNPFFGCTTGVFMEYNLHTEIGTESVSIKYRELDQKGPYYPCLELPKPQFRQTCFYEQPQWWNRVFSSDFGKIGSLCQAVTEPNEKKSCYLGSGSVAALSTEYDIPTIIEKCRKISDHTGMLLCLSGASWAFSAEPKKSELASQICDTLSAEDKVSCIQQSDLINAKSQIN